MPPSVPCLRPSGSTPSRPQAGSSATGLQGPRSFSTGAKPSSAPCWSPSASSSTGGSGRAKDIGVIRRRRPTANPAVIVISSISSVPCPRLYSGPRHFPRRAWSCRSPRITSPRKPGSSRGPLLVGLGGIALFQLADFLFDLIWLRDRSFAWMERLGQQTLGPGLRHSSHDHRRHGRGHVHRREPALLRRLHLPEDDAQLQRCPPAMATQTPPAWLSSAIDHIKAPKNKNTSFAQFWKQEDDQEAARLIRNEVPAR